MNTRNTIQRKIVLDAVQKLHDHPNAERVYSEVIKISPRISKATVYRNLNLLAEQGVIRKVNTAEGADRFDFRTDEHYHLHCRKCGKVLDAPDSICPQAESKVDGFTVEFVGLCADCQNKNNNN